MQRNVPPGPTVDPQASPVLLDATRPPSVAIYQPASGSYAGATIAVVSDDQRIWIWGGWSFLGGPYFPLLWSSLDAPTGTVGPVAAVQTTGGGVVLLAAIGNTLYTRNVGTFGFGAASGTWSPGTPLNGVTTIKRIAVARLPDGTQNEVIALVGDDQSLWMMHGPSDAPSLVHGVTVDGSVEPTVIWTSGSGQLVVAADANRQPIAIDPAAPNNPPSLNRPVAVDDGYGGFGVLIDPQLDEPVILFRPADAGNAFAPRSLVVWPVGGSAAPDELVTQETNLRGPPVAVQSLPAGGSTPRIVVLVPGDNRAVYFRNWSTPADTISIPAANLNGAVRLSLAPLLPADPTEGPELLESDPGTAQRKILRSGCAHAGGR